jgi:hypothetical protein
MSPEAQARCVNRMSRIDAMSPALRELVHEHGLTVIDAFLQCGVTEPRRIRHLITTVRAGSAEIGNREGSPALMNLGQDRITLSRAPVR